MLCGHKGCQNSPSSQRAWYSGSKREKLRQKGGGLLLRVVSPSLPLQQAKFFPTSGVLHTLFLPLGRLRQFSKLNAIHPSSFSLDITSSTKPSLTDPPTTLPTTVGAPDICSHGIMYLFFTEFPHIFLCNHWIFVYDLYNRSYAFLYPHLSIVPGTQ